jgi:PAS domain S-box-containing protein
MIQMTETHPSSTRTADSVLSTNGAPSEVSSSSSQESSCFGGSFQIDDIGRITSATTGTAEVFGYSPCEFVGMNFIRLIHRNNRTSVFEEFLSAFRNKQFSSKEMKVDGQCKDKSLVHLDLHPSFLTNSQSDIWVVDINVQK